MIFLVLFFRVLIMLNAVVDVHELSAIQELKITGDLLSLFKTFLNGG